MMPQLYTAVRSKESFHRFEPSSTWQVLKKKNSYKIAQALLVPLEPAIRALRNNMLGVWLLDAALPRPLAGMALFPARKTHNDWRSPLDWCGHENPTEARIGTDPC